MRSACGGVRLGLGRAGRSEIVHAPIHAAREVRLGEVAALGVVGPSVRFDASQVGEHDILAFSCDVTSASTRVYYEGREERTIVIERKGPALGSGGSTSAFTVRSLEL